MTVVERIQHATGMVLGAITVWVFVLWYSDRRRRTWTMTKTFRGYTPIEAPSFDLESPDGARKVTIKCVGFLPGSRFLDFLSEADGENPGTIASAVYGLLQAAVGPDSWDEFKSFVDDPANGIDMETLAEIAGYLGELYAKRPTTPSPVSSAG